MGKKYVKRFIFGLILITISYLLFYYNSKRGDFSWYTIFALIFLFMGLLFIMQAMIAPVMKRLMKWLEIERR